MLRMFIATLFGLQMMFFAPLKASAQMLSTHEVVKSTQPLSQQLLTELEKADTQAELNKMGLDPEEAKLRIAALSDNEIEQMLNGTQAHAGGDVIVVSLTTILLVVIIILLID